MQLTQRPVCEKTGNQRGMDVWEAMFYLQYNDFAGVSNGKHRFYFSRHWSEITMESGKHITTIGPGQFLQFYSYDVFHKLNTGIDSRGSSARSDTAF